MILTFEKVATVVNVRLDVDVWKFGRLDITLLSVIKEGIALLSQMSIALPINDRSEYFNACTTYPGKPEQLKSFLVF